jgi:hypothetical protein
MSERHTQAALTLARMDFGADGGRVPFFPMVVEEEFEQDRLVVAYGPYRELSLLGSAGVATSDREPMVVVAAEIPNRVSVTDDQGAAGVE